ncbi:MAG: AraC family transcriptional regulator [Balneola sp.]|nr:MAG: AraC family transcriptional regulator [Balneola sp.]
MLYERIQSPPSLSKFIDCFWVIESDDTTVHQQKIIPDGFPEIIFHYGDPYRINISGEWSAQSNQLLAGQIRNHFLLENTGRSGMIGIKFRPQGITTLFGTNMEPLTDDVVELETTLPGQFDPVSSMLLGKDHFSKKITALSSFLEDSVNSKETSDQLIDKVLQLIFTRNGVLSVSEIVDQLDVSERKLERSFKKFIGLSPKFYCRIIRFNYIFKLIKEQKLSWSELAYLSGYYDQSHFIKNFQEFTGEDPSKYFFEEETMANFFLNRPVEK